MQAKHGLRAATLHNNMTPAPINVQGVEDNGHPRGLSQAELDASLGVLRSMAAEVGAQAEVLQVRGWGGEGNPFELHLPGLGRSRVAACCARRAAAH